MKSQFHLVLMYSKASCSDPPSLRKSRYSISRVEVTNLFKGPLCFVHVVHPWSLISQNHPFHHHHGLTVILRYPWILWCQKQTWSMGQPDTELTWTWFGPQTRQNHILTPAFKLVTWLNKGNPKPEPDHNLILKPD